MKAIRNRRPGLQPTVHWGQSSGAMRIPQQLTSSVSATHPEPRNQCGNRPASKTPARAVEVPDS
ncbi:predicted protein [Streptomyces sp. AA4]|nr:predicted protein [Streptomyces sp. AA4]